MSRISTLLGAALTVDITPTATLPIGASLGRIGTKALEPLELNIASIAREDDGRPLIIMSFDTLYVGRVVEQRVRDAFPDIPADRMIFAASHNHQAPMLDDDKPLLGSADDTYLSFVAGAAIDGVRQVLLSRKIDANGFTKKLTVDMSINRRRFKRIVVRPSGISFKEVANAPNAKGPRDETVTMFLLGDSVDKPELIIWNYACHPVGHPERQAYSSHFPHVVRTALRDRYGDPNLPVLFLQGFSGNVRPNRTRHPRRISKIVQRALTGPVFDDFSKRSYSRWTRELADQILNDGVWKRLESSTITTALIHSENAGISLRNGTLKYVSVHGVNLGDDLSIIAVGGEVVAEYSNAIRSANPLKSMMLAGCANEVVGYLPTARILKEGGYEASGSWPFFNINDIPSTIEASLLDAIRTAARGKVNVPETLDEIL